VFLSCVWGVYNSNNTKVEFVFISPETFELSRFEYVSQEKVILLQVTTVLGTENKDKIIIIIIIFTNDSPIL